MKLKVETSTQVFIDGQPEPVRIADFVIDTKWDDHTLKNYVASICFPVVRQLQEDLINLKNSDLDKITK
jgi:hypothetical protein